MTTGRTKAAKHRRFAAVAWSTAVLAAGLSLASAAPARAQDAALQQEILFQQTLREPANIEVTFQFARVATANNDFEAAIGALERILFFQPGLARVKYELGALYFRMRSYEMARRYFKEALACADLDPVTRDRIETALPDAEKQLQQSRLSSYLQGGVRYQSNANYSPNGGVISLGGLDLALLSSATKKPDGNVFGLVGISHDYDIDARGDTFETRFVGYGTDQFRFQNLNVGLAELTFGPRFALAPELLPGATVKPYLVGGNTWVGGAQYLSIGGAGITANFPVAVRASITPGFEWNRVDVNTGGLAPVSTFNSGDWFTATLGGSAQVTDQITVRAAGLYRRGANASAIYFDFDQWEIDAAVTYAFASPFGTSLNWAVTPFTRIIWTDFDAPNPAIDPVTTRRDNQVSVGVIFDTPISKTFGVSTTFQYDHIYSTLPNYRLDNFSAMTGPTLRF